MNYRIVFNLGAGPMKKLCKDMPDVEENVKKLKANFTHFEYYIQKFTPMIGWINLGIL